MSTQCAMGGHKPELEAVKRVSKAVLAGLPITALSLCLGVATHAKPIIQRSSDSSTLAVVTWDAGGIDECAGGNSGGNLSLIHI